MSVSESYEVDMSTTSGTYTVPVSGGTPPISAGSPGIPSGAVSVAPPTAVADPGLMDKFMGYANKAKEAGQVVFANVAKNGLHTTQGKVAIALLSLLSIFGMYNGIRGIANAKDENGERKMGATIMRTVEVVGSAALMAGSIAAATDKMPGVATSWAERVLASKAPSRGPRSV